MTPRLGWSSPGLSTTSCQECEQLFSDTSDTSWTVFELQELGHQKIVILYEAVSFLMFLPDLICTD
jgi:hypothetical protein